MKTFLSILFSTLAINAYAADTPPSLDPKGCKFEYPKAALLNEEQGAVVLKVTVDATGNVIDASVDKSSGSKTLDKATVKVLNTCKFNPGIKGGKPAEATTTITYVWKLDK
jgi:protein TonB